ncbi:MAG: glutathione S-transferase family protein [Pseudomonadota bacterium]|nr:glutathione S-transferase family protein [Pseudomonadota bacterium]
MTIELYDLVGRDDRRFSPYCWRIRMALEHKKLEYQTIPVRFTDKHLIRFSDQNLIPVIRDGKNVVADSWNIAKYLENSYRDRPSLFGGEVEEGWSHFLSNWVDTTLHQATIRLVIADILDHVDKEDRNYFFKSRTARFGMTPAEMQSRSKADLDIFYEANGTLRSALGTSDFWGGETPSYKDYIVFGAFTWARAISQFVLLVKEDSIYKWRTRMLNLHDGLARKVGGYPV